ncbi:hypothetical protein [Sphingomonas changnyeongensis]|uniref:hypothetical protein n=1 Tax=Sphingomonas changnyeongensis TaxID=2698679 RepID=UPI001E608732|nr:hypothetical protein [Sphingomonas changnyeongensis]
MALARAAQDAGTGSEAALRIDQALDDWAAAQAGARIADRDDRAWALAMARLLRDREARAAAIARDTSAPAVPPGMPIGDGEG